MQGYYVLTCPKHGSAFRLTSLPSAKLWRSWRPKVAHETEPCMWQHKHQRGQIRGSDPCGLEGRGNRERPDARGRCGSLSRALDSGGQRGHCLRDDGHGLSAVREWCHEKLLDQLRRSAHLLGRLSRSLARQSGFPAPACRFIRLQCFRLGVVDKQLTAPMAAGKKPRCARRQLHVARLRRCGGKTG